MATSTRRRVRSATFGAVRKCEHIARSVHGVGGLPGLALAQTAGGRGFATLAVEPWESFRWLGQRGLLGRLLGKRNSVIRQSATVAFQKCADRGDQERSVEHRVGGLHGGAWLALREC